MPVDPRPPSSKLPQPTGDAKPARKARPLPPPSALSLPPVPLRHGKRLSGALAKIFAGGNADRPMPPKLLASLEDKQSVHTANIQLYLQARAMWTGSGMSDDRRTQLAWQIHSFYRELDQLGRPVFHLKSLKDRQARMLVANWVSKRLSLTTIQSKYNTLSSWRLTLGQHGSIDRLSDLLPPSYLEDSSILPQPRAGLTAEEVRTRSDYLRETGQSTGDLTAWLVDRVCRAFDVSVATALSISPAGVETVDGIVVANVSMERGRDQITLIGSTSERAQALSDAAEFCRAQGRKRLVVEGVPLYVMAERVRKRIAHATDRVRGEQAEEAS